MPETEVIVLKPQDGKQTAFLSTPADIALYGGAAGGGKSWSLLVEPLRHVNVKGFQAVIFRRTSPEITNPGGLWDESWKIYPGLGAVPNATDHEWLFPGDTTVKIGHMQFDKDLAGWFGSQIPYIAFDELTTFTRKQFFEMLARNRSTCGVQPYMRASCNPDPDSWVLELIDWYIDKPGDPIPERAGILRWFLVEGDTLVWGDTADEVKQKYPGRQPLSFTFIPAKLSDNKILVSQDPGYQSRLEALPLARRRALLDGNWRTHAIGKMFKREWFTRNRVQPGDVPPIVRMVTGVDPSGGHGPGNDAQGIVCSGKGRDALYYVFEDSTCKLPPAGWGAMVVNTHARNLGDCVAAEANYGGEMVRSNINTIDPRVKVKLVRATRGKEVRAEPIASLMEKNQIKFVGVFTDLENECVGFDPNENVPSPNRMDAFVWSITELMDGSSSNVY